MRDAVKEKQFIDFMNNLAEKTEDAGHAAQLRLYAHLMPGYWEWENDMRKRHPNGCPLPEFFEAIITATACLAAQAIENIVGRGKEGQSLATVMGNHFPAELVTQMNKAQLYGFIGVTEN